MTTASPPSEPAPPPLSFPVYAVSYACPNCGQPHAFRTRPAEVNDPLTRPAVCACGALLGYYVLGAGNMVRLRLAGPD